MSDIPGEAVIGALVMMPAFSGVEAKINYDRAARTQVAFSERGKTAKAAEREGKQVPPMTDFLSLNNDAMMIIFEANNIARETNRGPVAFAKELENIIDPALRVHYQMGKYVALVPPAADRALAALDHLTRAARDLPALTSELNETWGESHQDVTHTETDTTTACDANGQNCHTVTTTRTVYDYTIHSYKFYPGHAENADRLTSAFLQKHPDLSIAEELQLATKTEADNEYAIEKSLKDIFGGRMLMQEEALEYANKWATGSNLTKYRGVVTSRRAGLQSIAPDFGAARLTARSQTYTTFSSTDSGPKEYRIANTALDHATVLYESIHKIVDGISFARDAVPRLDAKIREFIAVTLDKEKGDPKALQDEIMKIARENYGKNYEDGLDVNPFKWEQVLLAALVGAVIGGGAGWAYSEFRPS